MLVHAKTRNTAVPRAPTIPFLPLGDARNCQLPSSSNQNKTSRHSAFSKFADNPDNSILLVVRGPLVRIRCGRFMFATENFGVRATPALKGSYPYSVVLSRAQAVTHTGGCICGSCNLRLGHGNSLYDVVASVSAGRFFSSAEALKLVQ